MTTKMKKILIGDVLTGLMVAAAFAAVVPGEALADLAAAVGRVNTEVGTPFETIVGYLCYGIGSVLTVAGIAQAKKHAEAPGSVTLGHVLGRLGVGAALLAAPTLVGTMQTTGTGLFTDASAAAAVNF